MSSPVTKVNTAVLKQSTSVEQWYLLDASDVILGRLATTVATLLRGKHQPTYTPHVPTNNHVIVINAGRIRVTGNKLEGKQYYRHSGRPGSLKQRNLGEELQRFPTRPLSKAVERMLPNNKLRAVWMRHLHLYRTADHPHQAQKPIEVTVNGQ